VISATELAVAALATWQVVEIWHHSSLFAPLRARAELLEGRLSELLGCPFCLSVWVGTLVGAVVLVPVPAAPDPAWGVAWVGMFLSGWLIGTAWNSLLRALHVPDSYPRWTYWFWGLVSVGLFVVWVYLLCSPGWPVVPWLAVLVLKLAVLGFALSRLANLGNDLTRHRCRTPRMNKLDHTGDGDDDTRPTAEEKQDVGPPPATVPGPGYWGGTPGGSPPV
jgi:hypothetical protein